MHTVGSATETAMLKQRHTNGIIQNFGALCVMNLFVRHVGKRGTINIRHKKIFQIPTKIPITFLPSNPSLFLETLSLNWSLFGQ